MAFEILSLTDSTCCRWTLRFCNFSSTHQLQVPFNMTFLPSSPVRKVWWHTCVPFSMSRSLVSGRSSLLRDRIACECLSSCTRATSSFLARFISRKTKCIEFTISICKVEFTLTARQLHATIQFEPMWQLSMQLSMTKLSIHRFDYVVSTALCSDASSQ